MVDAIWSVALEGLRARGIRGVIVDLDNTLVAWNRYQVPREVVDWARRAGEQGIQLCICSNTRQIERVQEVADRIGAIYVALAGKPTSRGFRRAMRMMGTSPRTTALIGDQIFTDIMGGNRLGLTTILVKPLSRRDFLATKFSRLLEWLVLKRITKDKREGQR